MLLTLTKRGSCEGRLGPHSTGSGGVSGAAAAGPPLVPRKAAAASDAASVRRHGGHGDTAEPGLGSRTLRGSPLLHPRAPSPPRPARAHRAPSVTRGFHAAFRRSRARAPPRPLPPPPHSPPLTSGPRPSGVARLRPCHVTREPIAGCARPAGTGATASSRRALVGQWAIAPPRPRHGAGQWARGAAVFESAAGGEGANGRRGRAPWACHGAQTDLLLGQVR